MVKVYENFYSDSYIDKCTRNTGDLHFLCAIDYTDDFKYVKCINSWGDYNDEHGYVYLNTKVVDLVEATAWVDTNVEEELRAFNFSDVDVKKWSYDAIQTCARNHLMDGFPDGTFQPEQPLTRAQACRVMCALLDLKPVEYRDCFTDMTNEHWACQFVQACYDAEIIHGMDDGKFEGEQYLTREQMAVILVNAYKIKITPYTPYNKFDDVSMEHWSRNYISTVCAEKLMVGMGDNKFSPQTPITREQMATVACKLIGADTAVSTI